MHTTTDVDLSPVERRSELATILAAGFLRLRARVRSCEEEAARREISGKKIVTPATTL